MTTSAFAAPSFDDGFYTWVTELAQRSPGGLDSAVRLWSDYGMVLFAVLMLASWWRSRGGDPARTAMALCAPLVVVSAYLVNDVVKSVFHEQRPCRTLHVVTVEACPPLGDWSFPSNHAAIAAAAATAIWLADRRLGAAALTAALLMGASRVWVGAHYPHDVLIGLLAGALVAWPLTSAARLCAPAVERLRDSRLRPLVTASR
ncbi:phosphatase PAP2 family protein [Streptomyces sp. NBC_01257]|uniref:phosphatase PAP2 family protein n=1 Tax=Streptomyces sp. NBC_01257 TaxID=2903799 RepID=UPI002DDA540B|nr:phosphatase PAP2 family protein [Streptomyces sp. NBC_01257]WRZ63022.1 phosphatase PAP2 family protein [Streptomyces sp. NBC_01257]